MGCAWTKWQIYNKFTINHIIYGGWDWEEDWIFTHEMQFRKRKTKIKEEWKDYLKLWGYEKQAKYEYEFKLTERIYIKFPDGKTINTFYISFINENEIDKEKYETPNDFFIANFWYEVRKWDKRIWEHRNVINSESQEEEEDEEEERKKEKETIYLNNPPKDEDDDIIYLNGPREENGIIYLN